MKDESTGDTESRTTKQLVDKITSLSQPQLARAADALSMIWNGAIEPLDSPALKPEPSFSANFTVTNANRVELALLRSISTGTFIDVQFCAYNAISNDVQLDPKPLFTSSIVIKGFSSAIEKRKSEGTSQFAPL